MSTPADKIAMLQRLADSTTFPAEREACLEKIALLREKLSQEPPPKEAPPQYHRQKTQEEEWIENVWENWQRFKFRGRREFAQSLVNQYLVRRTLSKKQWAWIEKLSGLIDRGEFGFTDQ